MLKVLASCNEGDEDLSRLTLSNELVLAVCKQEDWTSKQEKNDSNLCTGDDITHILRFRNRISLKNSVVGGND